VLTVTMWPLFSCRITRAVLIIIRLLAYKKGQAVKPNYPDF
jgi:hypothetical protein